MQLRRIEEVPMKPPAEPIGEQLLRATPRRPRTARILALTSAGALLVTLVGAGVSSLAGADAPPAFYLAVGASASVGVQPTLDSPHGQPTDRGYANDLVTLEAGQGLTLQLTQTGCPGESTVTMLNGGDRCYQAPNTQMLSAVAFLTAHRDQRGLVTVDLGFDNVMHCLRHNPDVVACVKRQIDDIRSQLPQILTALQSAAGPHVTLIGITHYDPFLADTLLGSSGKAKADASVDTVANLNQTLNGLYAAAGIAVADVPLAFESDSTAPVTVAGLGTLPDNVAAICNLTWMCQPAPYGPNLHPNGAGYRAIAQAIAAKIPANL